VDPGPAAAGPHEAEPVLDGANVGIGDLAQGAGLFYPDRCANVRQGRHLDYHWNGERVDFYRDAGSRQVFEIMP
jgi:hypothetical protein